MKMVMIAYNVAVELEVMESLEAVGVDSYTRWPKAHGSGQLSGPHLGTHVWPVENVVMAVVAPDEQAARLMDAIRELRKTLSKEGIKAFLLPVDDIT